MPRKPIDKFKTVTVKTKLGAYDVPKPFVHLGKNGDPNVNVFEVSGSPEFVDAAFAAIKQTDPEVVDGGVVMGRSYYGTRGKSNGLVGKVVHVDTSRKPHRAMLECGEQGSWIVKPDELVSAAGPFWPTSAIGILD